jgi:hypothetical protein
MSGITESGDISQGNGSKDSGYRGIVLGQALMGRDSC